MTTAIELGKTAGNRTNFRRRFKTDTTIFLHEDGWLCI
jgi:hypothetical protein